MKLDCCFSVLDFLFGPVFLFSEELELTGVELDLGLFISFSTLFNILLQDLNWHLCYPFV